MASLNSHLRINDRLRRLEFIQIRYLGARNFPELLRDGFLGFLIIATVFSMIPLNQFTFKIVIALTVSFHVVAIGGMAIALIAPVTITRVEDGYVATDVATGVQRWGSNPESALEELSEAVDSN